MFIALCVCFPSLRRFYVRIRAKCQTRRMCLVIIPVSATKPAQKHMPVSMHFRYTYIFHDATRLHVHHVPISSPPAYAFSSDSRASSHSTNMNNAPCFSPAQAALSQKPYPQQLNFDDRGACVDCHNPWIGFIQQRQLSLVLRSLPSYLDVSVRRALVSYTAMRLTEMTLCVHPIQNGNSSSQYVCEDEPPLRRT